MRGTTVICCEYDNGVFGNVVKAVEGQERITIEIAKDVKIDTERRFITDQVDKTDKK